MTELCPVCVASLGRWVSQAVGEEAGRCAGVWRWDTGEPCSTQVAEDSGRVSEGAGGSQHVKGNKRHGKKENERILSERKTRSE